MIAAVLAAALAFSFPPPVSFSQSTVRPGDEVYVRWDVPVKKAGKFTGCTEFGCQVRTTKSKFWVQKTPGGYGVWFTFTVPADACTGGAREIAWTGKVRGIQDPQTRTVLLVCP